MSGKAVRETMGFLAVVAGLVFVGLEIQQNTTVARAATRQALADASTSLGLRLLDPNLSQQYEEAINLPEGEEIDCADAHYEACVYMFTLLRHHENVFLQVQERVVDETVFASYGWANNPTYSGPSFSGVWFQVRQRFDPDFVAAFEAEYDLAP